MAPAPNRYHQKIVNNVAYLLRSYLEQNPAGEIYFAPFDVYLTDLNVYQPDVVYVASTRKAILTDRGAEGAPDLVVEVLSLKTARLDRGIKREVYARTGVKELWIINPELREVQVFRFVESADLPAGTYSGAAEFESPLFPGLKVSLTRIFAD